jgi:GTP-binding protein LepA
VSRSLAACEGALLVVDAAQGVEAQTLANVYLALDNNLRSSRCSTRSTCRPPTCPRRPRGDRGDHRPGRLDAAPLSAKTGLGVEDVLEAIIERVPRPKGDPEATLRALIFDSWFDSTAASSCWSASSTAIRRKGKVRVMATGQVTSAGAGRVQPRRRGQVESSKPGEVGFLITANIKEVATPASATPSPTTDNGATHPAVGLSRTCSRWSSRPLPDWTAPATTPCATRWRSCAQRRGLHLRARDLAALGFGFRCGFLGLLHMEIVQERLEREYDLDLITTAPTVVYKI